tara:strand:- start:1710 stop:1958 length:249 start_codon:yes stop_codon:yes gene_type:complete
MVLDEKKIQQEAKQILDKFASALAKVEKEGVGESFVDRDEFERIEGSSKGCDDENFKKKILENAPESDNDFIIVEKGGWKKL